MTPAEALIAFSELDYTDYRKVVRWLRDEHPLFEERIDIPVSDFEDFVAEAILLTPDLHEIDPVSRFVVTDILHWTLQAKDDGTAMFLLAAGQAILRVMEEPLRVQNYLRNIMEVTFDGTAGLTPAEQYEKLRDRMYSRLIRWQDAAPSERSNLMPMDYEQYDQWSENARLAREDYVQGKLTAEEFLRKIDTTHELPNYEAGKIDLPDGPSMWQRLVEKDFRFDPERYFPEKMARLNLSDPNPQWKILTADDLRREAQKGHQSLKEKYGK